MGVDRITDWMNRLGDYIVEEATGKDGFSRADDLWTSMQTNIISFIKDSARNGQAAFYSTPHYKARPKWNDVKEFLLGNITLEELKRRLKC